MAYLTTDELNAYRMAARIMIASGLVDYMQEDKAVTLMLLNRSRGVDPLTALTDYYITLDKPALKADAMLERFYKLGGSVVWESESTDNTTQKATFNFNGTLFTSEWTYARAEIAGFTSNPMWNTHGAQMLRARVISEGIRAVCPEVNKGLYTPEEAACFNSNRKSAPQPSLPLPEPPKPAPVAQAVAPAAAPVKPEAPKAELPKGEPKPTQMQKRKKAAAKASKKATPAPAPAVTGPQDTDGLIAEISTALHCGVDWYSIVNTVNAKYGINGELPDYVRDALVACAPKE